MKHFWTLFFALAITMTGTPAGASSPSCRLPGGRTVASDGLARLISVPTPTGAALFACIRHSGRKVALDDAYSDARLSGRWVAWQRPGRAEDWRIAVHDLRTGGERAVDGHVAHHSLRLSGRGSVVWAQQQKGSSTTPLYANETTRRGGRLLDGGAVDASSVRLSGRVVTWRSAGVRRSAIVR